MTPIRQEVKLRLQKPDQISLSYRLRWQEMALEFDTSSSLGPDGMSEADVPGKDPKKETKKGGPKRSARKAGKNDLWCQDCGQYLKLTCLR